MIPSPVLFDPSSELPKGRVTRKFSPPSPCAAALAAAALLLFGPGLTHSQAVTQTWGGGTGNWSSGGAWTSGTAPGALNTTSNADVALFNNATAGTVTVDAERNLTTINFDTTAGSYTLTGGPLVFSNNGVISIQSTMTATGQTETISAPLVLKGGQLTLQNNSSAALGDFLNITGSIINNTSGNSNLVLAGSDTGVSGTISGVIGNGGTYGSLYVNGSGTWVLAGANTFAGPTTLSSGTLQLNNSLALQNSNVALGSALTFQSGLGSATMEGINGSSALSLNDAGGRAVTLVLGTFWDSPYNGPLSAISYTGTLSGLGGVTKFGTITQNFSKNSTYTGMTTMDDGPLMDTGTAGVTTPFGTGGVTFNGGTLGFAPSDTGNVVSATIASGALGTQVTYAGGGVISLAHGNDTSLTVTAGYSGETGSVLNRANHGTLIIQSSGTATLGSSEFFKVNGIAPTVTYGMVTPSIIGYGVSTTGNLDFLTYGSNGFVSATANYTTHATGFTTTANEIADITSSVTATDSGGNPYAIVTGQDITLTVASGNTLTVGDGVDPAGIILNGNGSYGSNGGIGAGNSASTLNFGASEGIIYSSGWVKVAPIITGSGGMTFGGSGGSYGYSYGNNIQLTNNGNTFTGGITVNQGAVLMENNGSGSPGLGINGIFGDPNNVITLDGGGVSGVLNDVGVGRSIVIGAAGGSIVGVANFASNISGSGPVTIQNPGSGSGYGSLVSNAMVLLSGSNSFTGMLYLNTGATSVSSAQNLGAATAPITFMSGDMIVTGTSLTSFGSHPITWTYTGVPWGIDIQNAANTFTLNQPTSSTTTNTTSTGLYKFGLGTLVLTVPNTLYGPTGAFGGILKVDESQGGSLYPGSVTVSSPAAGNLTIAGGTLYFLGNSTGTTIQNVGNINVGSNGDFVGLNIGGGKLVVDNNGGNFTLNMGTLLYGAAGNTLNGSTLDIVEKGSGVSTVTTTTAPDTSTGASGSGIYGARVVFTDASGNTNWATAGAAVNGVRTLAGYAGYQPYSTDDYNDTTTDNAQQMDSYTATSASLTLNTLAVTTTTTGGSLNLNGQALTLTAGGLLFTGANAYAITSGTITSGLAGNFSSSTDLIIQQYATSGTAGALTISSTIANASGKTSTLTKDGPGTLILTANNTYTGATFINGGVLSLTSTNFGSTSGFNINGGTLRVTGNTNWVATLPGTLDVYTAGMTIDVNNGGTLTLPGFQTFSGGYNGGGPVVEDSGLTINSSDNSGGVVVLGNNAFSGGLNILGGVARLTTSSALGSTPNTYVTIASGTSTGDLQLNGYSAYLAGLVSTSTSAVVEDGNGSGSNVTLGVTNGDNETYAGRLVNTLSTGSGKLGLFKAGAGTLSLTNTNNSFTGVTEIDGGNLNVASLAAGGANSSIGASTNVAANLVFGGGALQYTGGTAQTTDHLFTLGDSGVGGNTGVIDASGSVSSATLTFSNTGAIAFGNTGVHSLTLTGGNTGANTFASSLGDSTYNSTVFSTSLIKSGVGTWVLTGNSSYTGSTTALGGTLIVSGSLPRTASVGLDPSTLEVDGSLNTAATISSTNSTLQGTGVVGTVNLTNSSTLAPGLTSTGFLASAALHAGNVTFSDTGSALSLGLGIVTGSDGTQLVSNGTVTLNKTALQLTLGSALNNPSNIGLAYIILNGGAAGTGSGSDVFSYGGAALANTNTFTTGIYTFEVLYGGIGVGTNDIGNSNDDELVLIAVPEPGTWAMLLSGAAMLMGLQRMRRRRN